MEVPLEKKYCNDVILNFDGNHEWGKDKGSGYSSPTGNAGATQEKCYKKRVLIIWTKKIH